MPRLLFHSSCGSGAGACRPGRTAGPRSSTASLVGLVVAAALSGCAAHGRLAIPANADRIASGSGAKLTVVNVMRWGRLHVMDRDDDSILWAGDVHVGQTLVINGFAHKVLLDGRTVAEGVEPRHHYVVFMS